MKMVNYSTFMGLVSALLKDGHIHYAMGSKPSLMAKPDKIKSCDCSGFVRYLLYNASDGAITIGNGGGTWFENKWCQDENLEEVGYSTAANNDGYLRIAFIHGGGTKIGHVWLIYAGK